MTEWLNWLNWTALIVYPIKLLKNLHTVKSTISHTQIYGSWQMHRVMSPAHSPVAQGVKNLPECRRHRKFRFDPWVGKVLWRRAQQPTSLFLLEIPIDRGAWWTTVQRIAKSWTWLSTHTCVCITYIKSVTEIFTPSYYPLALNLVSRPSYWQ